MKRLRSYMSGHLLSEINPEALIRWIWILAPVLPWPAANEWSTFLRDASCFCHRRQFHPPSHLWHSKLQVGFRSQKKFDSTRRGSEALRNRNHSWCKSLKLLSIQYFKLTPVTLRGSSISNLMSVSFHQCRKPLRLSICRSTLFCKQ